MAFLWKIRMVLIWGYDPSLLGYALLLGSPGWRGGCASRENGLHEF